MLEAIIGRLKRDKHGLSNVIVVMLSLILIVIIVANVVLWSYQMSQFDWERTQENIEILHVTRIAGWLSGWNYRKSHIIQNASGAGTGYQVKITVHYGTGTDGGEHVYLNENCRTDFGDVRFTDDDGVTLLDYWMQEYTSGDQAIFWVKIADNLDHSSATVYVYYGNPSATSTSNGTSTFEFFDDFDDGVIDSSKWTDVTNAGESGGTFRGNGGNQRTWARTHLTFSSNIEARFRMRGESTNDFDSGIRVGNLYFISDRGTGNPRIGTWWVYPSGSADDVLTWHRYRVTVLSSYQEFYDITADKGVTSSFSYTPGYLYLIGDSDNGARDTFYDWIFVRKYTSPEPSHGVWGSEEVDIGSVSGLFIELRNKGSMTVHLVSVWVNNSTFHKQYDVNFFINSGDTSYLIVPSTSLPNNYYMVKVISERGNIKVYIVE